MLILLINTLFAGLVFWIMWSPLGGGKLVRGLLRDEKAELREELEEVEQKLSELADDPDPDETTVMLQTHFETEARNLRRQLED